MSKRNWLVAAGIVGFGTTSILLFFLPPTSKSLWPGCVFSQITGIYCFGCGATRSWYHFLHGDFLASLHDNAVLVPLLALVLLLLYKPKWGTYRSVTYPVLILLILFGLLRNIPFYPFSLLAPLPL